MVSLQCTGIRKINFKDYAQEAVGAPDIGALWGGSTNAPWSIGLGNGALPTTYKGLGYRHLLQAAVATYNRKYVQTPGANAWWHTQQQQTGKRYQHQYDFMVRVNTTWPGVGVGEGACFGYFMEVDGAWNETSGYRIRVDGTNVYLEQIDPLNPNSWLQIGTTTVTLAVDTDYYFRVTYFPTDWVSWDGYTHPTAGYHFIYITDNINMRGTDNILNWSLLGAAPLTGNVNTTLLLGGYNSINAEFDGITYSNGFMEAKPGTMHYHASIPRQRTDLYFSFPVPSQGKFTHLATGDIIEMWVKERVFTKDVGVTEVVTDSIKLVLDFDGRIYNIKAEDNSSRVGLYAFDSYTHEYSDQEEERAITAATGTYYDYLMTLLCEYQGQANKAQRASIYPGVDSTAWAVNISANWTSKGSMQMMFKIMSEITKTFIFWSANGFLISNTAPIPTGRAFDFNQLNSGELQQFIGVSRIDVKRDHFANQVNQYHDNGAGVVVNTQSNDLGTQKAHGTVAQNEIDVALPPAEGAAKSANKLNQMKDTTDAYDVITLAYGYDLYPGCRVRLKAADKSFDESNMTIIEKEYGYSDDPEYPLKNIIRFRVVHQIDTEMAREVTSKRLLFEGLRKDGEYHDFNWT